jgi:hypothetical protein
MTSGGYKKAPVGAKSTFRDEMQAENGIPRRLFGDFFEANRLYYRIAIIWIASKMK